MQMRMLNTTACLFLLAGGAMAASAAEPAAAPPVAPSDQAPAQAIEAPSATPAVEATDGVAETAVSAPAPAQPVEDSVTVTSVTGQAQIKEANAAAWRTIKAGETIPTGAMIRTGLRSEVGLRLSSGSEVKVGMLARGTVGDALTSAPSQRSTLRLDYGDVDARLARTGYKNFTVVVPERTLAVSPMLAGPGGESTPRHTDRFAIPGGPAQHRFTPPARELNGRDVSVGAPATDR